MKVLEKSLKEYWHATKLFLAATLVLALVQIALSFFDLSMLSNITLFAISIVFSIISLVIAFMAGWFAVRKHKFNLKQVAFIGVLLFLVVIWLVPLSLPIDTSQLSFAKLIYVYLVNTAILAAINIAILAAVAVFGGWVAKIKMKK